jgi:TolB-like protein
MKFRFKFFGFSIFILVLVGCTSAPSSSSNTGNVTLTGKRGSIALFPLTGARQEDGEAIISSLARQRIMRDAFEKVTPLTQSNITAMNYERDFQKYSLLTDPDSIFEIGKDLKADYVIAGNLTKLGSQNLVIISILGVESLQQIAGVAKPYNTLSDIDSMIPVIANDLVSAVSRDTSGLKGLSVPPFSISSDVNQNDSMVLAQILSCELSNAGNFAILPRTDSLQTVLMEHQRQRTGDYDKERVKRLGNGRNASYVLSGKVESLGDITKFAVDILDIEDGSIVDGYARNYTNSSQALGLVSELAGLLTGRLSEKDIAAADAKAKADAQKAEAERQKQLAAANKKAEADAKQKERELARERFWAYHKRYAYRNTIAAWTNLYFQWDGDDFWGGGVNVVDFHSSPVPFISLGGELRAGMTNMEGYGNGPGPDLGLGLTTGVLWPFSSGFKIYADGMLDIGYNSGIKGIIASFIAPGYINITPGFIIGLSFDGDKSGFKIQYRGTWYENRYIHALCIGVLFEMGAGSKWARFVPD